MVDLFLSSYKNKIDSKGRVSLPSQFREIVTSSSKEKSIVIYKSLLSNTLEGCTIDYMQKMYEKIENLDEFSNEKSLFSIAIFGDSIILNIDDDGRINLPKKYTEYANIQDQIIFVGKGKKFEICNDIIFDDYQENARKFAINNLKIIK